MTSRARPLVHARYAPGEELGAGAQGRVVRVIDAEHPERALVAKVFEPGTFDETSLLGEFALLARVRAPGLVRAHDLARDEASGAPFLVEEYVDGPDASAWIGAVPERERPGRLVAILVQVARALGALHEAGFAHGDLKPVHVRVADPQGSARATLLDLGAAVAHARANVADAGFTRAFAAPERLAGATASPAGDLYGLGAVAFAAVTGAAPDVARPRPLRGFAPWLAPSIADVVDDLLAPEPADRIASASAVLERLGVASTHAKVAVDLPAPIGRESELAVLLEGPEPVRYVTGPAGIGKTHLARELRTRWLLAGRPARWIGSANADGAIARLVSFLRGAAVAWPFVAPAGEDMLVVLDDLDASPELSAALDGYRCRVTATAAGGPCFVATARAAPAGAAQIALGPLEPADVEKLARTLAVAGPAVLAANGSPGWLAASAGRVPLTQAAALERAANLSADARAVLASIAVAGGELADATARRVVPRADRAIAELAAASLVSRRAAPQLAHTLSAPALAPALAAALGTFELSNALAVALLAEPSPSPRALLAVARADALPDRRAELAAKAADRARAEGLRSEEIDSLLLVASWRERRTGALLARLERLSRDGGTPVHPEVLEWLEAAAAEDVTLRPLALRRRAEQLARAGNLTGARERAEAALAAACQGADPAAIAFAHATSGAVALYRADWMAAEAAFVEAHARLAGVEGADAEELARLDHNAGVVALYRGRLDAACDAFARSLEIKRRLGDRAGARACLLNLGIARTKTGDLDGAERALDEAARLARSLGQAAGLGWCHAARADLEVHRRRPEEAERWIAEARSLDAALPAAVRAELSIASAEAALLGGDGVRALGALAALDPEIVADDALIEARSSLAAAAAHLATLPASPRAAARLAIRAARRARASGLADVEHQALDVLRRARARRGAARAATQRYVSAMAPAAPDDALWAWLAGPAASAVGAHAVEALAGALAARARAERAFVLAVGDDGRIISAFGADLDGLPLGDAAKRAPEAAVREALRASGPVHVGDVETVGGRGSRLAAAGPVPPAGTPRAVIVLEHRFETRCFDGVDASEALRWAALAAVALRLAASDERAASLAPTPVVGAADVAASRRPAAREMTTALPASGPARAFPSLLGASPSLRRALARLEAALSADLPVLLVGETGVGKELFARALHDHGRRAGRPFVAVDCASLPDGLVESELFGHARGSFTGADRARPGLIGRADGGTLFLDEIGELPVVRQASLLRALETRRYRPVGSDDEIAFDVRVVAATNRDLEQEIERGAFRRDLYYRLAAVTLPIPPLREREGDVPLLALGFLRRAGSKASLAPAALEALESYAWPGNVRELEHQMQRLAALGGSRIELDHLPRSIRAARVAELRAPRAAGDPREDEREEVRGALDATGGNITRAAERLGLTRHGLKKRMVRLGLRPAATGEEPA